MDFYSWWVRFFKVSLILIALGCVGVIFVYPKLFPQTAMTFGNNIQVQTNMDQASQSTTIHNPEVHSRDKENNPVYFTAKQVVPNSQEMRIVDLTSPSGELTLKTGNTLAVSSEFGHLNQDEKRLTLDGKVMVQRSDGLVLETESAKVNLENKDIVSNSKVKAVVQNGQFEANQGIEILGEGQNIMLKGSSKVEFSSGQGPIALPSTDSFFTAVSSQ